MFRKFLGGTVFCLLLTPTAALGQLSDFPMSPIQYPSAMSSIPLATTTSTRETIRVSMDNRRPANSSTVNLNSLAYQASSSRRKSNLSNFANRMRQRDPHGAAALGRIIAPSDPIAQIGNAMRSVGLNANNVADCYAVYWIAAWEAKYNRDLGPNRAMYQAVRDQSAQAMLGTQQLQSASDATKQEAAEALLLQAALITSAKELYQNDKQKLALLANAVDQGAQASGLNLTEMTLTPNGFVPRNGGRSDASDQAADNTRLAADDEGGGNLALYAVAGTGLLAGVFALGKGLSKKG